MKASLSVLRDTARAPQPPNNQPTGHQMSRLKTLYILYYIYVMVHLYNWLLFGYYWLFGYFPNETFFLKA